MLHAFFISNAVCVALCLPCSASSSSFLSLCLLSLLFYNTPTLQRPLLCRWEKKTGKSKPQLTDHECFGFCRLLPIFDATMQRHSIAIPTRSKTPLSPIFLVIIHPIFTQHHIYIYIPAQYTIHIITNSQYNHWLFGYTVRAPCTGYDGTCINFYIFLWEIAFTNL